MSTLFSTPGERAATPDAEESAVDGGDVVRPGRRHVDGNAVRWIFAATVAFWLVVYAAGRSLF